MTVTEAYGNARPPSEQLDWIDFLHILQGARPLVHFQRKT